MDRTRNGRWGLLQKVDNGKGHWEATGNLGYARRADAEREVRRLGPHFKVHDLGAWRDLAKHETNRLRKNKP